MKLRIFALLAAAALFLTACGDTSTPSDSHQDPDAPQNEVVSRDPDREYTFTSQELEIPSRSTTIFATLTLPQGEEKERFPLVVMNHDLGSDREEGGGFTALAEALARRGIASVRMDFTGSGQSPELFRKANLFDMKTDSMAALEYALLELPIDPAHTGVLGYGFGGRVAVETASSLEEPFRAMVLLAPSIEPGSDFMVRYFGSEQTYERLRAEAFTEQRYAAFSVDGVTREFGDLWFDDLLRSRPLDRLPNFTGDLLLVYGEEDLLSPVEVNRNALALAEDTADSATGLALPGVDHGLGLHDDDSAARTQVLEAVVTFFDEKLR